MSHHAKRLVGAGKAHSAAFGPSRQERDNPSSAKECHCDNPV